MRALGKVELSKIAGGMQMMSKSPVGGSHYAVMHPDEQNYYYMGLLGGLNARSLSNYAAEANFQDTYQNLQVQAGDCLKFNYTSCSIFNVNGQELASGEIEIGQGLTDIGEAFLESDGDWYDGAEKLMTGVGDIAAGSIEMYKATNNEIAAPDSTQHIADHEMHSVHGESIV